MKIIRFMSNRLFVLAAIALFGASLTTANADEPCPGNSHYDEFGECKVLVEVNSTDGDIGFHFLIDGDNLIRNSLFNPHWRKIFSYYTRREAREQTLTETFVESAEPLCWEPPEYDEEEDGDIVPLEDFIDLWKQGRYYFLGVSNEHDLAFGYTRLDFDLPAAPTGLAYKEEEECEIEDGVEDCDIEGEISWEMGNDLGNCADYGRLAGLVADGDLPIHPADVEVAAWEVVLEPDVDDGDPLGAAKYTVRMVAKDDEGEYLDTEMGVPDDYLETLPDDTLVKIEVGAIGAGDNATFTEIFDICVNEDEGCEEED